MSGTTDSGDTEGSAHSVTTFDWRQTPATLRQALEAVRLVRDERSFTGTDAAGFEHRFRPPLVLAGLLDAADDVDAFARALEDPQHEELGRQAVVLLRAGAAALGAWDDESLAAHKVFKRYVVRGKGRAQPSHLAAKGKSRYGSRLRLQNAKRLLEESRDRLAEWNAVAEFTTVYIGCPVRLWSDFEQQPGGLPFAPDRLVRIPFHVHEPSHKELLRVRRSLSRGRWERRPTT